MKKKEQIDIYKPQLHSLIHLHYHYYFLKNDREHSSNCGFVLPFSAFHLRTNPNPTLIQLENVFMKHYAPNHMPDPKGEWTLKENNSELHHGIYSKVNQFIYTLVCNYMPNIRILDKAVLQIFRSQGCSYTNAYVRKTE